MAAPLNIVADYVSLARTLLQDTYDGPYRYTDVELALALSLAFTEAKKLRPDLFIGKTLPTFTAANSDVVDMDEMYRVPLVYYIIGHVQLRDDEAVQDQRAAAFLGLFQSKFSSVT